MPGGHCDVISGECDDRCADVDCPRGRSVIKRMASVRAFNAQLVRVKLTALRDLTVFYIDS